MSNQEHDRGTRPTHGRVVTWIRTATAGSVVRRAIGYAVVVGAVLILINHGDAIAAGRLDAGRALKMALTVLVPYCVSTASSVSAILERPPRDPA